jgi:hypothetical protein
MPLVATSANAGRVPKARLARIESLCAASTPSMSKLGSASAKPERLRLGEHFGEVAALGLHLGQDEIAGAVEDAVDPRDLVRGGAFAQALDDRDAAGDRCFELQRDLRGFGGLGEFEPVMREHRLVGGDEGSCRRRASRAQARGQGRPSRRPLDHDIGILVVGERGGVVDPFEAADIDAAILGAVARGDGDDLDRPAGAARGGFAFGGSARSMRRFACLAMASLLRIRDVVSAVTRKR